MEDLGAFNDPNAASWAAGAQAGYSFDLSGFQILPGDVGDMAQQRFIPPVAQQQGMAWWESIAAYGITRAIDNRFGPAPVSGNVQPGSFAGQNGRTYNNAPQATGRTTAPAKQGDGGIGVALLAGLAALAFF